MKILSSKKYQVFLLTKLKHDVKQIASKGIKCCLAIITTKNDYASKIFIKQKQKICQQLGIKLIIKNLNYANNSTLIKEIKKININKNIHGLIVQLPTNKNIVGLSWMKYISHHKDVDCFHPHNLLHVAKNKTIKPCVVDATLLLLKHYKISLQNKKILIINKDKWIGFALRKIFKANHANVIITNINNPRLFKLCKKQDIVIAAIGKPHILKAKYFNNHCVIIDIGISYDPKTKKVAGDVDLNSFLQLEKCHNQISPVPGGIGPLTTTMVVANLIKLIKLSLLSN